MTRLTEEEYLRIERASEYKSEFIGCEMFAMPAGTSRHAMLGANTIAELRFQLRGKRYRVMNSEMRVRTPDSGSQLYPDASVACGPIQMHPGASDLMVNPSKCSPRQRQATIAASNSDSIASFQLSAAT